MKKKLMNEIGISNLLKVLKIMRLSAFLLMVFVLQTVASTSYSQQAQLTLNLENVKVIDVLNEIESSTNFYFLFNKDLVDVERVVSISADQKKINQVLSDLFKDTNVKFVVLDRQIVLTTNKDGAVQDAGQKQITGKVTDASGQALPGVAIQIKGTTIGTITDLDGNFSLSEVSSTATLVLSFIGMKTQEISVGNSSVINVIMEEDAIGLEEVVAIGYGVVKKSDLTGSVSSLREDDMNTGVTTSVDQLLQGKSAGVQITQASAEPGGGITIQIRGASSIGASSAPLYVIDGLPIANGAIVSGSGADIANSPTPRNPLNNINPSDIESIEILKDASATAIYGARGANGVVLVTTKKGAQGKLKITYNGYAGVQQSAGKVEVLNAQDYMQVLNDIQKTDGSNVSGTEIVTGIDGNGTDWQDELYRVAPVQSHSLSFTGGNDASKFFASLNYFDQDGIVINSGFKRYDTRFNLEHKTDNFNFGLNFSTAYTLDDFVSYGYDTNESSGVLYSAINFDPTVSIFGEDGRYTVSDFLNTDNPLALANGEISSAENYRTLGTIFGEYTIMPGWTAKLNVGFDTRNSTRDAYVTTLTKSGLGNNGIATILTATNNNYLGEFTSTYIKDFDENNSLTVMAGMTYQKFISRSFNGTGRDFPADESLTYAMEMGNAELYTMNSGKQNHKLISYIGRANYSLLNKYLFTVTFRADGSSRFGENNKYGYFPSGAFAWKMHEEDFIKNLDLFSSLKFRASVGRTGNQSIGNYQSLTTFDKGQNVILGDQQTVSLEPVRIANRDLKWETTEQINVGFDMGFLQNRIFATMDYFQKNTYDMLFPLPIPSNTGFNTILQNIGNIKNDGFELTIDTKNTTGKLKWNTSLNVSTVKNRVTDLGDIPEIVHIGAGWTQQVAIIRKGEPLNSFYGYKTEGIWQSEEEITASGTLDPVKPGDVHYTDTNGDHVVNSSDRVILGKSFPDFTFGITNTLEYKGIGLNVFIDGVQGVEALNNAMVETYFPVSHRRNRLAEPYLNRWTPENPSTEYPSFVDPTNQGNKGVSSITVEDASYVRLHSVRLSYDLPLRSTKIFDSVNLYVSGQNLLVLTKYSGVDPTTNSSGNVSAKIDFNSYPVARTFILGVQLGL
ncbi:TonB-dependent receptor [Sunxiuqinia sp. A32]|uniref:TonB-dependent receptor n=1 Tax=Sunxiuqinia sp. A32 TaxID=3461496 RepID=UPI00404583C1